MLKPCNVVLAILDQPPREWVGTRNAWGIFSRRSHERQGGAPKQFYGTAHAAERAATAMSQRHGTSFDAYKCVFCDGHHVGKGRA